MSRFRLAPILLAVAGALALQALPAAAGPTTTYTTDPGYLTNVTGENTDQEPCTWAVGGHIRGEMGFGTIMGHPVKAYSFSSHDNTVCDATSGLAHQGIIRLKGVSGLGGGKKALFFYQAQFHMGSEVYASGPVVPVQYELESVNDEIDIYRVSSWLSTPQRPTSTDFKFKVGTWQGDQLPFQAKASTPAL